jgi:NADH-quinone oxidoreductase subunit L
MEGPTPVSALLHAATMVTLGIFLILRMSDILAQHSYLLVWLLFIGSLTIIVVSFISVLNSDLKKVIAFSTCSQLGYMFIGCGCGEFLETVYSLVLHAFFKAMLFLAAGYIIYLASSEQDMRTIGGFY